MLSASWQPSSCYLLENTLDHVENKSYRRKQGIPEMANFKDVESPSIFLPITVQRRHACRIQTVPRRRFTAVKSVCPCGLRVGNERIILPT